MILVTGRGLSQRPVEHPVDWPAGWRLPSVGEAVHLTPELGGRVEFLDWDLGRRALLVFLR